MQIIRVADRQQFFSGSVGGDNTSTLDIIIDALQAKHASAYVQVHYADGDTDVAVPFEHGPDGQIWHDGASDLLAEANISEGLLAESTVVSVDSAAKMRVKVKLSQGSPSSQVKAILSVWVVLKPF